MASGTMELAPYDEGDDRRQDVVATGTTELIDTTDPELDEAELDEFLRTAADERTRPAEDVPATHDAELPAEQDEVVGVRALFSNIMPGVQGARGVLNAVSEARTNRLAGTNEGIAFIDPQERFRRRMARHAGRTTLRLIGGR